MRIFAPTIVVIFSLTHGMTRESGVLADAPPPPNPAIDAGDKWPARRKHLETEWLKLLGPFPANKPALDIEVLSTEILPSSPSDPNYPIRAGDIARYKVKFRSEADEGVERNRTFGSTAGCWCPIP